VNSIRFGLISEASIGKVITAQRLACRGAYNDSRFHEHDHAGFDCPD
jgi:hypothetical protein